MSKFEVEKLGKELKLEGRSEATERQRREVNSSILYIFFSLDVLLKSVEGLTDFCVVENQSAVNYLAPGIFPKT